MEEKKTISQPKKKREINPKVEHHKKICKELNRTYAAKNSDYGDSWTKSIDEWGLSAGAVRINDKINRINTLLKNKNPKVKDESLIDSCKDCANYLIMLAMYLENKGKKP